MAGLLGIVGLSLIAAVPFALLSWLIQRAAGASRPDDSDVAAWLAAQQKVTHPRRHYDHCVPDPRRSRWSSPVVQLAHALDEGEDCAFALHDALLESGHEDVAEHLRQPDQVRSVIRIILAES